MILFEDLWLGVRNMGHRKNGTITFRRSLVCIKLYKINSCQFPGTGVF